MSDYKCTVTYCNEDWEWEGFSVSLEAEATSIHEDMVMYYKDGSGYPGYDGIEDIEYTINSIVDEDGNELELNDKGFPVNWSEEQVKALDNAINGFLDGVEWEYPDPYYPEPPEREDD